jgi:hypothetical protein
MPKGMSVSLKYRQPAHPCLLQHYSQ